MATRKKAASAVAAPVISKKQARSAAFKEVTAKAARSAALTPSGVGKSTYGFASVANPSGGPKRARSTVMGEGTKTAGAGGGLVKRRLSGSPFIGVAKAS